MPDSFKADPEVKNLFYKHFDLFDFYGQLGLAKN